MHELVYMSAQHSDTPASPPRPPLPGSLLVWPTAGNSYSLVITGRMMCALKCALPAWLPLTKAHRGQRRGARRGAKDRVRTERKWWERGGWPRQWILQLITRGIWPDKQYCALQMSIVWGISGATISIGGDGGGGGREREADGEVWRLRYESDTAEVASHILLKLTVGKKSV